MKDRKEKKINIIQISCDDDQLNALCNYLHDQKIEFVLQQSPYRNYIHNFEDHKQPF